MASMSCVIYRMPPVARHLTLFAPASTRACLGAHRVFGRHNIHTISSQVQASTKRVSVDNAQFNEPPSSSLSHQKADIPPGWRHPIWGFTAQEASRFISIDVSPSATESDVNTLLDRASVQREHILMRYNLESAIPTGRCYIKIVNTEGVDAAIATLSQFNLLGRSLQPKKFELEKLSPADLYALYGGWLPSPSSDLASRVVRPPMTAPPKLLIPLMNEQWIVVQHLEALDPGLLSRVDETREVARFDVLRNFYTSFHHFDVVGIMDPYKHSRQGWCSRILFGGRKDAREAARIWREAYQGKRRSTANAFRGGADIHGKLWKYRQSLPENTPRENISDLLEMKYRELRWGQSDADQLRRFEYPTSESAVGFKTNAAIST